MMRPGQPGCIMIAIVAVLNDSRQPRWNRCHAESHYYTEALGLKALPARRVDAFKRGYRGRSSAS